jgi:hypothetical protein
VEGGNTKALGRGPPLGRFETHNEMILAILRATPHIVIEDLRRKRVDVGLVFGEGTSVGSSSGTASRAKPLITGSGVPSLARSPES